MDLSLSVSPLIPSLQLPALLSWRVFVWHYFRLFVMGVLPETLFLLSVWHSEWTRPWFCLLLPHHHLKSCSVCISKMHIHIVFFSLFPPPISSFLPQTCTCIRLIYLCYVAFHFDNVLLGKSNVFIVGEKSVSVLPREWLIFPSFVFSPIYFIRLTLQLPIIVFFPLCLLFSPLISCFSRFFILFSSPTLCFHLFSLLQPPSVLACVAKIQPWGYIASFMWGPVVTLKACNVVCRFASAQL